MTPPGVLVVVGSRPEAIKLARVVHVLRQRPDLFETVLCSTGQQRDLIPQALAEFELEAEVELNVMRPRQSLGQLGSRLMAALDDVMRQLSPRWVIVQGDTTSAMIGALTAFYRRIPVAHVEAGMRTDDPQSPFPEEINRRIVTQCSTVHFAATAKCVKRLLQEGVPPARIVLTGNTVVDALLWMRARLQRRPSPLPSAVREQIEGRRLIFVTAHRRESFDGGIARIADAVARLVATIPDAVAVMPVHPNPAVDQVVRSKLGGVDRVILIEPQPYSTTVGLLDRAQLVLTDSGGLQEEAPTFGVPLLVMRDTTERPEGIEAGVATLVGTNTDRIVESAVEILTNPAAHSRMAACRNPYGDGEAAERIASCLFNWECDAPVAALEGAQAPALVGMDRAFA